MKDRAETKRALNFLNDLKVLMATHHAEISIEHDGLGDATMHLDMEQLVQERDDESYDVLAPYVTLDLGACINLTTCRNALTQEKKS